MIYQTLEAELTQLAKTPGIIACVLVSADAGMVFMSSAKNPEVEAMAEAARDYWALHQKNGQLFATLGSVHNIFIQHSRAVLTVQGFGKASMLLVTIARLSGVDWRSWPAQTQALADILLQLDAEQGA